MDNFQFPLLEYDGSQHAVIDPDHEKLGLHLPEAAVFAVLGDTVDDYAREHQCAALSEFVSATKNYPIYLAKHKGREICLCQAPVGAPAAVQIMDWLISYGVRHVLATGSCGVLVDIAENEFLVPAKAIRDEVTSYHYLPPARSIETDPETRAVIEKTFLEKGLRYRECTTWTTDGFYRETRDKVVKRIGEGCITVEMECAALAACARFRGVKFGEFFFTADSLAQLDQHDLREFGVSSRKPALLLALDIASKIER